MENFFTQSEVKLFSYRLQFYDTLKFGFLLQKASKHAQFILFNKSYITKSYADILQSLTIVNEQLKQAIENEEQFFKVPFTSALKFVKDRLYHLYLGNVFIPMKDIKLYLVPLYEDILTKGIHQMKNSLCLFELQDSKMYYLHRKIKKWLYLKFSNSDVLQNNIYFSESNLNKECNKFPLCMLNLHKRLYKHHRLKHTSRIQYILFLKEIGVSCSDVKKLFMQEYSVSISNNLNESHAICSHNWNDSEKRYIYSIEHLYGMRGACKNYKAHSCLTLQNTYDSDGGCPFATFDKEHLTKLLLSQSIEVEDIEDIVVDSQKKEYQTACCKYLCNKIVQQHKNTDTHCFKKEILNDRIFNKINIRKSIKKNGTLSCINSLGTNILFSQTLQFTSPSQFYFILLKYFNT